MTSVSVHGPTGVLLVDGRKVFPIGLSDPPPLGSPALVDFVGLPPASKGEVLFEYVQRPLPPPRRPGKQVPRTVKLAAGGFRDWFSAHDAHVYRFTPA